MFKIIPQYIIDKFDKKTGMILDMSIYEQLLEEIEDVYFESMAHKALQEEQDYIEHTAIKKKLNQH